MSEEKIKKLAWILSELEAEGKLSTSSISYEDLAGLIINMLEG